MERKKFIKNPKPKPKPKLTSGTGKLNETAAEILSTKKIEKLEGKKSKYIEKTRKFEISVLEVLKNRNLYTNGLIKKVEEINKNLKQNKRKLTTINTKGENAEQILQSTFEEVKNLQEKYKILKIKKNQENRDKIEENAKKIEKLNKKKLYKETTEIALAKIPKTPKKFKDHCRKNFDRRFKQSIDKEINANLKNLIEILKSANKAFENSEIKELLKSFDNDFKNLNAENLWNSFLHPRIAERSEKALSKEDFIRDYIKHEKNYKKKQSLIINQVLAGNIPDSYKMMVPITSVINGEKITYYTIKNRIAIGTEENNIEIPVDGPTAQAICDITNTILPNEELVDKTYKAAKNINFIALKPSSEMKKMRYFIKHNKSLKASYGDKEKVLIAGHFKTILAPKKNKLGFYGGRYPNGKVIQQNNGSHIMEYTDYSHGLRLYGKIAYKENGEPIFLEEIIGKNEKYKYEKSLTKDTTTNTAKVLSTVKMPVTSKAKKISRSSGSSRQSGTTRYTPSTKSANKSYINPTPKSFPTQAVKEPINKIQTTETTPKTPDSNTKKIDTTNIPKKHIEAKVNKNEFITSSKLNRFKFNPKEINVVSDSTLQYMRRAGSVASRFGKLYYDDKDYFNNKGYTKGATYLVNNRDKKAIQALEEPNCKLLILSAGYNDLSKLRVKGKGPDKNKYFYKKETIVNQIKDSFKTIIEKAHSYKPPKKIVLFLINRKKPSKHSRENEATKEINRWLIEESNADVIVNPRNLEIKNNKKHFRDAAHFTPECEDEIFKALQKHLIKTKETPSSSTNYKGKTPIKTPAGYKRVANAPQEIQEQAVVLLKAILKDPNHENQIGKTQKTVKDKNGREWLLVADVHGANEFNKKAHLGISAFPKKT